MNRFDIDGTLSGRAYKRLNANRLKRLVRGVLIAIGIALCSAQPAGQAQTMQLKSVDPALYSTYMIGEIQTQCLFNIALKESNIRYNAVNKSSGAYGAWQLLHKSAKGASAHKQVELAIDYANYRYGSPCKAWEYWKRNYWW